MAEGVIRAAGLAAGLAAAAVSVAAAQDGIGDERGAWEMSLDGSHRKCRVTLGSEADAKRPGAEKARPGQPLRFPAGCRRALPILNTTASWASDDGLIRFLGGDGQAVLAFARRPADEDGLVARASTGETYFLEQRERAPPEPEPGATDPDEPEPVRIAARLMPPLFARPVPPPTPIDPEKAPPFAALPGVYAIDRYFSREVCRISLGPAMLDASGRYEARLIEGCHDNGLHAFDPVAWRYGAGRLTLEARRGHEVTLISERDGQWRRDPDVGATLVLRKAEP